MEHQQLGSSAVVEIPSLEVDPTRMTTKACHAIRYRRAFRPEQPKLKLKQFAVELNGNGIKPIIHPQKTIITVVDPDALYLAASFAANDGSNRLVMWQRNNPSTGQLDTKLPKRYMSERQREDRFGIAVDRLVEKVDVKPMTVPRMSTSPLIVFPGTLPLVVSQFACTIHRPQTLYPNKNGFDAIHSFSDKHYGFTEVVAVPTKDIISNLFRGYFRDPHALRAAIAIESSHRVHELLPDDVKHFVDSSSIQRVGAHQIANAKKLDSLVWREPPHPVPTIMKATRVRSVANASLGVKNRTFQQLDQDNKVIHEVHVESIHSKQKLNHQVVILAYVKAKDESGETGYYSLVNLGNREQAVRALSNNIIQTEKTNINVEPFSYWASTTPTHEDVKEKCLEYSGMKVIGEPVSIGSFPLSEDYAPDFNTECFLVEVDASTFSSAAPLEGLYQTFVPLNEMKRALRNGIVRNIPLAVMTDVLGAAGEYQFDTIQPFRLESDAEAYRQMMLRGSHFRDLLQESFAQQFKNLNRSSTFKRILEEVFNHGFGLKDSGEQFYSCLIEFGMLAELPQLERFILLLHDWYHGIQGDLIPWDFSSNPPKMIPKADYIKGVLINEGQAVYFSDVFLAQRYGHDNWKSEGTELSLGEALLNCGVKEGNLRAATVALVRDPEISLNIKNHPAFEESKGPIEYYHSYHTRDTKNASQAYEYWQLHPEVARSVLMFNNRCRSKLKDHTSTVRVTIANIRAETSRGLNPLRHELYELKDVTLFKLALRASVVADETEHLSLRENMLTLRSNLEEIQKELSDLDQNVHGFHPSEGNIGVFNRMRMLSEEVQEKEQHMKSLLLDYGYPQFEVDKLFTRIPLWAAPFKDA